MSTIELPKLGALHSPLTTLIVDTLRERIVSGELAPGTRLVEGKLSEELGVSRVPVREALRLLAADGIVTIAPRMGASVTSFSPEQVRELVEVRATLEGLNAKLAARRHDPEQIRELERILAEGVKLSKSADTAMLSERNRQFHDVLGTAANNSVLSDMMRSLRARTSPLFAPYNREPGRAVRNWDEHAEILRAIIAGDAELAALLSARHVYSAANLQPSN